MAIIEAVGKVDHLIPTAYFHHLKDAIIQLINETWVNRER